MLPIGPLMIEHRLIERMVKLLKGELVRINESARVNTNFIDAAVDFFRIYADRTHHGKEEDILFKGLDKKKQSSEHRKIMEELIREHVYARKNVGALVEAKERYAKGGSNALDDIIKHLNNLIKLYPAHIEKEDKHFFLPVMKYFNKREQEDMLAKFREFDRRMIHEKYKKVVENFETK